MLLPIHHAARLLLQGEHVLLAEREANLQVLHGLTHFRHHGILAHERLYRASQSEVRRQLSRIQERIAQRRRYFSTSEPRGDCSALICVSVHGIHGIAHQLLRDGTDEVGGHRWLPLPGR